MARNLASLTCLVCYYQMQGKGNIDLRFAQDIIRRGERIGFAMLRRTHDLPRQIIRFEPRSKVRSLQTFKKPEAKRASGFLNGRGERIRTSGLLLPKQARYQAALRPDTGRAMPIAATSGAVKESRIRKLRKSRGVLRRRDLLTRRHDHYCLYRCRRLSGEGRNL